MHHALQDLAEPLVTLIVKAKALGAPDASSSPSSGRISGSGGGGVVGGGGPVSSLDAAKLRGQAFVRPDRFAATLADVHARLGIRARPAAKPAAAADAAATGDTAGDTAGDKAGDTAGAEADVVGSALAVVLDKMSLFLDSGVTRSILFKPVQRKVATDRVLFCSHSRHFPRVTINWDPREIELRQ